MQIPKPDLPPIVSRITDNAVESANLHESASTAGGSVADVAANLLKARNSSVSQLLNSKAGATVPFPALPSELRAPMKALSSSIEALTGGLNGMEIEASQLRVLTNTAIGNSGLLLGAVDTMLERKGGEPGNGNPDQIEQLRSTARSVLSVIENGTIAIEQAILDTAVAVITFAVNVTGLAAAVCSSSGMAGGTAALVSASMKAAASLPALAGKAMETPGLVKGDQAAANKEAMESYSGNYAEYIASYVSSLGDATGLIDTLMEKRDQPLGQILKMMQTMSKAQEKLLSEGSS